MLLPRWTALPAGAELRGANEDGLLDSVDVRSVFRCFFGFVKCRRRLSSAGKRRSGKRGSKRSSGEGIPAKQGMRSGRTSRLCMKKCKNPQTFRVGLRRHLFVSVSPKQQVRLFAVRALSASV